MIVIGSYVICYYLNLIRLTRTNCPFYTVPIYSSNNDKIVVGISIIEILFYTVL